MFFCFFLYIEIQLIEKEKKKHNMRISDVNFDLKFVPKKRGFRLNLKINGLRLSVTVGAVTPFFALKNYLEKNVVGSLSSDVLPATHNGCPFT